MSAGRDFLLFIFFLIILGVLWFVTGGPNRTISHSGWFINPPSPLGNGQAYGGLSVPSVPLPDVSNQGTGNSSSQTDTSQNQQSIWSYFFNYRVGLGESPEPLASPYASSVYLESATAASSDPKTEFLVIDISQSVKNTIVLTGWTVESGTTGARAVIGDAAQIAYLGGMNATYPFSVGPGTRVFLTTGRSPNGTSFRINECTGYFNQFQKFTPSLSQECPNPQDELLKRPQQLAGNDTCYNFVQTIPNCTLTLSAIPGNVGGICQDFILNTLSYNGCINAHKDDANFYRNEWRIFLERDQELWKNNHDVIRLLDENQKLVAEISY